jgi:hypothetical protein
MEQHTAWLKRQYQDAPLAGPSAKRVKFSTVHEALEQQFTPTKFSAHMVSQAIKEAFPQSLSKACGKSRQKHIFGIEPVTSDTPVTQIRQPSIDAATCTSLLESERAKNRELQNRIQQLEHQVFTLERSACLTYDLQLGNVLQHGHQVVNGPVTCEHFYEFSIDTVIAELQANAPDVYQLLMTLGKADRNRTSEDDNTKVEELRTVMAMCTLLKARSLFQIDIHPCLMSLLVLLLRFIIFQNGR